jgi:hypothetical protein
MASGAEHSDLQGTARRVDTSRLPAVHNDESLQVVEECDRTRRRHRKSTSIGRQVKF